MMEWNTDISKAPRDGTKILIHTESREEDLAVWRDLESGWYRLNGYAWYGEKDVYKDDEILGWHPIPLPPKKKHE